MLAVLSAMGLALARGMSLSDVVDGFVEGARSMTIGAIILTVIWFRAIRGHFTPRDHFGFEAAAWYWHFVDVVWLFLFMAIYIWGSG